MDILRTVLFLLGDCIFPPGEDAVRVRELSLEQLRQLRTLTLYKDVQTLFPYRNPFIKSALWQLKYHDDTRVAHLLGDILRETLLTEIASPHLLVPIPLSAQRLRERGYNQVERIALPAVDTLAFLTLATHVLERRHHTPPQTRLGKQERLQNLEGVFVVPDPHQVRGKDIILLDDVVTTGSTLKHARTALLQAGAKSVTMVALAH